MKWKDWSKIRPIYRTSCALSIAMLSATSSTAYANGLEESYAWKFRSDFDRSALAATLDMIERKKGGFYDGFDTIVNNVSATNIGTQINCGNTSNAIGNEADNGQSGNAPNVDAQISNTADAKGSESNGQTSGDGGSIGSTQTNSGSVTSGSGGNVSSLATGSVGGGETNAVLNNDQNNSGSQSASVSDSIACGMDGSTFNGDVVSDSQNGMVGPIN